MLKGIMHNDKGEKILFIGLLRDNVERLQQGQPINFKMMERNDIDFCFIIYGDTAEDILKSFRDQGIRIDYRWDGVSLN